MNAKEFRECRNKFDPIPWGGWKMLCGIIWAGCFAGAIFFLASGRTDGIALVALIFWGIIAVSVMVAIYLFVRDILDLGVWPFTFLVDYWQRNVVGYEVRYWCDPKTDPYELQCRVFGPALGQRRCTEKEVWNSPHPIHVVAPLGGWWNTPRLRFNKSVHANHESLFPRFRLKKMRWERDEFWVIDHRGGKVKLLLHGNLFFHMMSVIDLWKSEDGFPSKQWEHLLWGFARRKRCLEEELEHRNKLIADLQRRLDEKEKLSWLLGMKEQALCGFIRDTIAALDASKRFIRSKEAKEIRERLDARLKEHASK